MINPDVLASLLFPEAAEVWLEAHARHIQPGTVRHYRLCITALTRFFGELRLAEIHIGHFEEYQRMRSHGEGGLRAAGPSVVNHELNTLSQILNRAGLWAPMATHYMPLPLPRPTVGCALTEEEEVRLFRAAASNPRWKIGYCCALIAANTTADGSEIRFLRIRDVNAQPPNASIRIWEGTKNDYRKRTIPLNEPAAWAARELLKRAAEKGATEPEHYLLPHRAPDGQVGFDPTRPLYSWRSSWERLRVAAGLPKLRFKDLRHHSITRLLEDEDVSERTVIDLAGHISRAMLERYSHIRMRTKREAVDALAKKGVRAIARAPLILVKR
jgi:integrase